MIKAVLFDLDGVLTTDATGTTSIVKYIDKHTDLDKDLFEKAYRKHNWKLLYGRTTHEEMWPSLCTDLGQALDIDILRKAFNETPMDYGMIALSKYLKAHGYLIGMVTDNKRDRIEQIIQHNHLEDLFDVVTISADIGSGKKEKYIFDVTLNKVNLPYESCVLIDNNRDNLVIPCEHGMNTIFYDHDNRDFPALLQQLESMNINLESFE
ncbi:MAG: HAD hydrolase-like protein [Clostridiales bacterium]|nr:HAD hydrolase-like protein [Clostridiales bacterium]